MAHRNTMLLERTGPATDVPIEVRSKDHKFGGGGGSGYVPKGNYRLRITAAEAVLKKDDATKRNLHLTAQTVGPAGYEGVMINTWHPIPMGDDSTEDYAKAERNLKDLFGSMFSCRGRYEEYVARDVTKFTPAQMVGSEVCAMTDVEDYKDRSQARIAFYISAETYAANPGPFEAASGAPADASGDDVPDLAEPPKTATKGNAKTAPATSTPKAAVDDMLDW